MSTNQERTWRPRVQLGFGYGALVTLGLMVGVLGAAVGGAVIAGLGAGIGAAALGLGAGVLGERALRRRVRARREAGLPLVRLAGARLEIPLLPGQVTLDLSAPLTVRTSYWHRPASSATNTHAQYLTSLELHQGEVAARVWSSEPVRREALVKAGFLEPASEHVAPHTAPGVELALADVLAVFGAVRGRRASAG